MLFETFIDEHISEIAKYINTPNMEDQNYKH